MILLQIKSLLLPTKRLTTFQQRLHSFRAYELPKLLTEHGKLLPSGCLHDLILWQSLVNKVVEKELGHGVPKIAKKGNLRKLTQVEQNAIIYTAGSVIRKLLDKYKSDTEMTHCLNELIKEKDEVDEYDTSKVWLNISDRGGLYHITDVGTDLFMEIETFIYNHLVKKDVADVNSLCKMACEDLDILNIWAECVPEVHSVEKLTVLLFELIKEWTKLRGHSIADMEMEKYKKKKDSATKKKRSLRNELKRKTDNL